MAMATARSRGRKHDEQQTGEDDVEDALEEQAQLRHVAAVQRNGGELADILDGAVPGQAVVHVGNDAQIDAVLASLNQHVLNDLPLAGRGEEDLVHKVLAGVLEQSIESAHHFARGYGKAALRAGKIDEALERVAQVANALQVMAQRVGLGAGAHDENIARADAAVELAIEKNAIGKAAKAQGHGHQSDGDEHNAPRNVVGVHQVERAGEQKAGGEAGLHAQPLLMEIAGEAHGVVEIETAAGQDEGCRISAQQGEQNTHGPALDQRAMHESLGSAHGAGMQLVQRGKSGCGKHGKPVHPHPSFEAPRPLRPASDPTAALTLMGRGHSG